MRKYYDDWIDIGFRTNDREMVIKNVERRFKEQMDKQRQREEDEARIENKRIETQRLIRENKRRFRGNLLCLSVGALTGTILSLTLAFEAAWLNQKDNSDPKSSGVLTNYAVEDAADRCTKSAMNELRVIYHHRAQNFDFPYNTQAKDVDFGALIYAQDYVRDCTKRKLSEKFGDKGEFHGSFIKVSFKNDPRSGRLQLNAQPGITIR